MEQTVFTIFSTVVIVTCFLKRNNSYFLGILTFFSFCLLLPFVFEISYDHVTSYIPGFEGVSNNLASFDISGDIEYGFMQILSVGHLLTNEYNYLMIFIYAFIYYNWSNIFYKYKINILFIAVLYLFYPFLLDAIQTRNFLAAFFVILGIFQLIENKPKCQFRFLLYLILATMIHRTAIFYLPFLFMSNSEQLTKRLKYFAASCIVVSTILYFNYGITQVLSNFFEGRYTYYFEQQRFGFLIPTFQILAGYLLSRYIYKLERKTSGKSIAEIFQGKSIQEKYIVVMYYISLLSFFFIILCLINNNFERMFRNILILYYGLMWIAFKRYRSKKLLPILILFLIFFIGGTGLEYYRYSESEEVLITILNIISGLMNLF